MLYYLASPYTLYPGGIEAAYRLACKASAELMRRGLSVFSPIAHTHGIAVHGGIDPKNHEFWLAADGPFMRVCDALIVLKGEGWQESKGIAREIAAFQKAGKPIWIIGPPDPERRTSLSWVPHWSA